MTDDTSGQRPLEQLPPPDLTGLRMVVHTADSGDRSLEVSFFLNVQQKLTTDNYDAALGDAVLRHAHARGHMPIGPILTTERKATAADVDERMEHPSHGFQRLSLRVEATNGNLLLVTGECELGLSV
jgi:hypothetical protein